MNRHDQELLATQMRTVSPSSSEGVLGLTVVAAFTLGLAIGGLLFAYHGDRTDEPQRVAALLLPHAAPPAVQQ